MSKRPPMTAMQTPGPAVHRPKMGAIRQHGLTLIELMVSLVLGLVLIGGVLNIFVSNRETYRVTENLTRMQENARTGFDFMARDLREAGQNPCGTRLVANLIRESSAIPWWADWNKGTVIGIDGSQNRTDIVAFGTSKNDRVAGTDAIVVIRAAQDEKTVTAHTAATHQITLASATGMTADDVDLVVGCDLKNAAIFQVGPDNTVPNVMSYAPGGASLNTSTAIKIFDDTSTTPTSVLNPSLVSKLNTSFWYVGYGTGGKRALYRTRLIAKTISGVKTITFEREEMITGVQDLQIDYLTKDASSLPPTLAANWVNASDGTSFPGASSTVTGNWQTDDLAAQPLQAIAARITMTLQSEDDVGTNRAPLQRQLIHVVGLRSRDSSL